MVDTEAVGPIQGTALEKGENNNIKDPFSKVIQAIFGSAESY